MKYLTTFTGIGGLDWGLEKIGAECIGFSEIKESSVKIYLRHYLNRRNFGDITRVIPEDLPDFDILTGGFPCQSFSIAGLRRGFKDRRGQMIFYLYDILLAKKPEFAVFENVKGILMHDKGKTYRNVFKLLSFAGYNVRVVLLNALNYGSAQNRERVIFLCRRGMDFFAEKPEVVDDTKRFRDFRDCNASHFRWVGRKPFARFEDGKGKGFVAIGGYDRVNTITTGISSSGRDQIIVQEVDGRFRYMTALEAERLQGFPDGWTEGESESARWFALGNAVNCRMSDYLFTNYLKKVWTI